MTRCPLCHGAAGLGPSGCCVRCHNVSDGFALLGVGSSVVVFLHLQACFGHLPFLSSLGLTLLFALAGQVLGLLAPLPVYLLWRQRRP